MEQKKVKNLYKPLQRDDESVFYTSEKINNTLIKKAKRSNYSKDKVFLNLYKQLENSVNIKESSDEPLIIPTYLPFVEQKKVFNRSTLYIINSPFDLLHADIADLRFLAKSAIDANYCLLFVDLFTQKIYTYPMKKRNLLAKKLSYFTRT